MNCRICQNEVTETVIDLGHQYLSDFRYDDKKPKKYPLELMRCPICNFVQLKESAPLNEMYTENYGFKSGVNNTIKADLKDIAEQAQSYIQHTPLASDRGRKMVLDIGSNDGTLLSFYDHNYFKVGIDPIKKLCEEADWHADKVINDFFSIEAMDKHFLRKQYDAITAISMFYDVMFPDKLVSDMADLLKQDGVLIIQQNYILATLVNNAYDNICHEHIGYHSLLSMEFLLGRHGLEVVDVSTSMVNGGVLRTVIQHKGVGFVHPSVQKQRDIEKEYGLETSAAYIKFRSEVEEGAKKLRNLLSEIRDRGEKVYIYGASTRGGTIWQYVGLDVRDLPFAVDRNPEKVGRKIASIGVPIISEQEARKNLPEYMLVSIWFFKEEVIAREQSYINRGGTLIFPLPELTMINSSGETKL